MIRIHGGQGDVGRRKLRGLLAAATLMLMIPALTPSPAAAGQYLIDADAISAGQTHTCAIRKADPSDQAGLVACWGENTYGQIGDGTTTTRLTAVEVKRPDGTEPFDDVVAIAASRHTCALRETRQVLCWGANGYGQLGNGTTSGGANPLPVQVKGIGSVGLLDDAVAVAAGLSHSCAIRSGGQVVCWGRNGSGQLGNTVSGSPVDSSVPVEVKGPGGIGLLNDATAITTGWDHSCAIRSGGQVVCWGKSDLGQLGNGVSGVGTKSTVPLVVSGVGGIGVLPAITSLATGSNQNCAIASDDRTLCWGHNSVGQLGNGSGSGHSATPVEVKGVGGSGLLGDVTTIAAGEARSCAIQQGGQALCWGNNSSGALGIGSTNPASSSLPVQVKGVGGSGLLNATTITSGSLHTCAVQSGDGQAVCWGSNSQGQLGTPGTYTAPARVRAGFEPLTVVPASNGSVTSDVGGITCGSTCHADYSPDEVVTLTATADPGFAFHGWGGACSGTSTTCAVTMDRYKRVTADFGLDFPLSVAKSGTGTGTVTSQPAGITCGTTCQADLAEGTAVTLTAIPDQGSVFTGWSGDGCTGNTPTCLVTMDQARLVTATFKPAPVVPDDNNVVFDGKKLHVRLKCGSQYRPKCDTLAVPVISKGKKAKPMARPLKRKIKAGKWIKVTFVIKPAYRAKVQQMTTKTSKQLWVRLQVKSRKIGKKKFTGKARTLYHRYRVRSAG